MFAPKGLSSSKIKESQMTAKVSNIHNSINESFFWIRILLISLLLSASSVRKVKKRHCYFSDRKIRWAMNSSRMWPEFEGKNASDTTKIWGRHVHCAWLHLMCLIMQTLYRNHKFYKSFLVAAVQFGNWNMPSSGHSTMLLFYSQYVMDTSKLSKVTT